MSYHLVLEHNEYHMLRVALGHKSFVETIQNPSTQYVIRQTYRSLKEKVKAAKDDMHASE